MDYSDDWRSLWPVLSVFAAPSLLPSSAPDNPVGPLLFSSSSPPLTLISSSSLALHIPTPLPSNSYIEGLLSFFRRPENDAFLPYSAIDTLAADAALSAASSPAADPLPSNSLVALRCRNGSSMVLFFPTGPNANWIGYAGLSFRGSALPELRNDTGGDVFELREGYKHPYHRILKMSVAAAGQDSWSTEEASAVPGNPLVEGFLIATTLYSINWFRVETRVSDFSKERPFIVPLAQQGFETAVVHACWSPHLVEESAALLESGDLCWFNLQTKRGGTMRLALADEDDPVEWLSCEFGGQLWTVIVACSKAVLLVDLRSTKGTGRKVLAQIEMPSSLHVVPSVEMNDPFIAFCKASYNHLHFAVVTAHQLLLFDVRKPLVPVLTWNHGLESPRYIAMFSLSELRPSNEFKWASESGFAILIGSFWNNVFTLFCYGPRKLGAAADCSLYAWELPSSLILSDNECISGDCIVREILSEDNLLCPSTSQQKKNMVVGFCMVPNDIFATDSESGEFSLIKLTLSGNLEMQRYHASSKLSCTDIKFKVEDQQVHDSKISSGGLQSKVSKRRDFFRLYYLYEYMNGNLSNALAMCDPESNIKDICQISFGHDMDELRSHILNASKLSSSSFVNEVSFPTSIFEVACRRTLNCLRSDIFPLVFSKYSDMYKSYGSSTFEFLEIPSSFLDKKVLSFFAAKPSRKSGKLFNKSLPEQAIVGPLLPIPVLIALQQNDKGRSSSSKYDPDDDLLSNQCRTVLKDVFPEFSIADTTTDCNVLGATDDLQAEKPYFVYEPKQNSTSSTDYRTSSEAAVQIKQEPPGMHQMKSCSLLYKDEKFSTFLCGVAEKVGSPDSRSDNWRAEMFDVSPLKLDFDVTQVELQPTQEKIFKSLRRQFSKWQENYKPYQDFCALSKI